MRKEKKFLIKIMILILIFLIMAVAIVVLLKQLSPKTNLGVWWWNDTLSVEYLDFAAKEGVTEIYYCSDNFDATTNEFIAKAKEYDIKVFWLSGEYQWIQDSTSLKQKLERYKEYQSNYKNKFSGIHLDIEPHQHPEFDTKRNELLTSFVKLVYNLKKESSKIWIEYDIPFWFDDEVELNGKTKPAYQHIMDNSNRVTIMSYRDTFEEIYSIAEEEIEYAKKINKTLNLGVETRSTEGDKVSFMEEGKKEMYNQILKLRQKLPNNFIVSIHQIKTWYELKD